MRTGDFKQMVNGAGFKFEARGQWRGKRHCSGTFWCAVNVDYADITATPEESVKDLNPDAVPAGGVVVAYLRNNSSDNTEHSYGIPPSRDAYLWVTSENGKARYSVVILGANDADPITVSAKKTYRRCPGHNQQTKISLFRFTGCEHKWSSEGDDSSDDGSEILFRSNSFFQYDEFFDEAWTSCYRGCCVAEN